MWGRKNKIAKVITPEEEEKQEIEEPREVRTIKTQEIKQEKEQPEEAEHKARIVEGSLLDSGLIRYTILSTKSLGEIGEEFELD